jgi:ubiquinol-cytochrome c reductase iron-sulfur subunit
MENDQNQMDSGGKTRRDFIVDTAIGVACVGGVVAAVPFVSSLSPSADVLAVGSTEVELDKIKEGDTATVMWRGNPVFVRHRTQTEIEEAQKVSLTDLIDQQSDEDRVKKGQEKWLVTLAVCTHLGCVPLSNKGDFGGWLCPCHGSHYDTSGRIRKGPAPQNLPVPPYAFLSENKIKIG